MSVLTSAAAPLTLVLARARRRRALWLPAAAGIALATAFAGGVVAESTISADRSARAVLASLSPQDSVVRVTWQGLVTPSVQRAARSLLSQLGLGSQTEIVLLNPVRLGGVVVRPAAIEPLPRWADGGSPGPCLPGSCPMLLDGAAPHRAELDAPGVRVQIRGTIHLRSAIPLGFLPGVTSSGGPPLLVTGDVTGLEQLAGLSGVYRTHGWLAPTKTTELHAWQLASTERRLQLTQAALQLSGSQFTLAAPFAGLDSARAQAAAAPRRLLLAGGGALAALALFVVIAAGGLRRDHHAELERLRVAGATLAQSAAFVLCEAAMLCGFAMLVGALLAVAAGTLLAEASGSPVGGVLEHGLLTPVSAVALAGGWICATALLSVLLLVRGARLADTLAVAAVAALIVGLGRETSGSDPLPVLLAPLCCLAAGVVVYRGAGALLRTGERLARRGPVLARLALIGLARAPAAPSLAISFIAVSTGLGGFALAYRATLLRGAADQAADRVPLDALIAAAPDFTRPLDLAPLAQWRSIAGGVALPVRRTEASFANGAATVTVPAVGLPASALAKLHGWRAADASTPLPELARRLSPPGPTRMAGPRLPAGARYISLQAAAPGIAVAVRADLRDGSGAIRQVALGYAGAVARTLRAPLPHGSWELDAIELDEPTGLELTNGHQNGENAAAATQSATSVTLEALRARGAAGRTLASLRVGSWRAVGAASGAHQRGSATIVRFSANGSSGLLRPPQPSDVRPLPVVVDPSTMASAGHADRLALTVDGVPVNARVVGVLARFPTLASDAAGFVVADEQRLADALDAQAPGQGRADELWLATTNLARLRAAMRRAPLRQLSFTFRPDVERQLRSDPIARGVLRTLVGAASLSAALAALGLLVSMLGSTRDGRVERDLFDQGMGPRSLRRELRARMLLAGTLGVIAGLGVAALLTRLAVATVRAAGIVDAPRPPLLTVAPWAQLGIWGLAALAVLAASSWAATRSLLRTGAIP